MLLETSPGHATRCADTAYVDAFAREKRAARRPKASARRDAWAQLEQLNLGRLRIAAKGLRARRRSRSSTVDADDAAARGHVHDRPGRGAARATLLDRRAARRRQRPAAPRCSRAAPHGASAPMTRASPTSRSSASPRSSPARPTPTRSGRTSSPARTRSARSRPSAGTSRPTTIRPRSALDAGKQDAVQVGRLPRRRSVRPARVRHPAEVARRDRAGAAARARDRAARARRRRLRRPRVRPRAHVGDLRRRGRHRPVERVRLPRAVPALRRAAARRRSTQSLPIAVRGLVPRRAVERDRRAASRTGSISAASTTPSTPPARPRSPRSTWRSRSSSPAPSDMVLCGGADLHNSINDYLMFASVHALSPTGQCHTFDATADGIALGEGVACVVLKRLADAERDGDRIYAVIKGVAGASDGKSLGLTAPRKEGQVRALDRAYAHGRRVAGRGRARRGARHRHRRRRSHRARDADRGLHARPARRPARACSAR